MDGDGTHRTQEDFSRDFRPRRAEKNKALTTEKENLCLYGLPDETWEVNLSAKEVIPQLLEPVLGLNFAWDGEKDWPSLVAVHSDAWLPAVAMYFGARFGFVKDSRTNLMKLPPNYKDGFLMKHSDRFGVGSWFVKTAVSVLQNQTIMMNAVTDSGNVVYKDCIDASAAAGTSKINILVRLLSGRTTCICLWKTDHIGQLMSHIEDQEGIPKMHMMLLYGRTTLEDGCCLSDYNMENNSTVNVIHGLRGGCRVTVHYFLSSEQYLLEQSDEWTSGEKWLTDDAKRKIHSIYHVIFLLHENNLCLGDILVKDIPIYLDRAMVPPTATEHFTVEKGKRDYDSFIAYLKGVFSTPRPIELVNFLDALENKPHDIVDIKYHRYLYCYWGLLTSARRSDYMIETGNICKEGKLEAKDEIDKIMNSINLGSWFYPILQEEPFRGLNDEAKIPPYSEVQHAIIIFMRDSLEHAPKTCNRLQMEKIFYSKYWHIWDTLNQSLINQESDLINFIEHYVTY